MAFFTISFFSICHFTGRKKACARRIDYRTTSNNDPMGSLACLPFFCGVFTNACSVWKQTALIRTQTKHFRGWLERTVANPAGSILSGCSLPANFWKDTQASFTGMVRHASRIFQTSGDDLFEEMMPWSETHRKDEQELTAQDASLPIG